VCSPHATAIEVPRAMQDENAATLKIPLFIQLKLAGALGRIDVLNPLFCPEKQIPTLSSNWENF